MIGFKFILCFFGLVSAASVGAGEFKTLSGTQVLNSKKIPMDAVQTYSDLIVLPDLHPTYPFEIRLQFKVDRQYRGVSANPWESFWLFWSYNLDGAGRKKTNYIVFKTNGLEIGKASGITTQEFVWTDSQPKIVVGEWNDLLLSQGETQLEVKLNDRFVNLEGLELKKLYRHPGRIALYAEDAKVIVRKFRIRFAQGSGL